MGAVHSRSSARGHRPDRLPLAAGAASPLLARKKRRMPVIAGNGIAILVPAAITLAILSARGEFGTPFVIVQTIELLAGAVNLALIASNIRNGMRLANCIP